LRPKRSEGKAKMDDLTKPVKGLEQQEMINHPTHYNLHPSGIECIDISEQMQSNLSKVVEYIWRARFKWDAKEDYRKAIWYMEREISRTEKGYIPPAVYPKLTGEQTRAIVKGFTSKHLRVCVQSLLFAEFETPHLPGSQSQAPDHNKRVELIKEAISALRLHALEEEGEI
jgi:hypothetical protein